MMVTIEELGAGATTREFDAAPRIGDIVRAFGMRLTVIEAEWSCEGSLTLRVADTLRGHRFVLASEEWWTCSTCGMSVQSSVPPNSQHFPKGAIFITTQEFVSCEEFQVNGVMEE